MIKPAPRVIKRRKPVSVPFPLIRNLEFVGEHQTDSIVLGNYGDAKVTAKGNFQLSGIVLCRKNTFEIDMEGIGTISFKGRCDNLIIHKISGECTLDLSDLACRSMKCLSATGKSTIILGRTKVIEQLIIGNDTMVRYKGKPILENHSITDNARFEEVVEAA